MEIELASHKAVVCLTICTGHCYCVQDITAVSLAYWDQEYEVPVFGQKMHPRCLDTVFLLQDGVIDG